MLQYLSQARDIYDQHDARMRTAFGAMLQDDGHRVVMDIDPDTNTVCGVMVATLARGAKTYLVVSVLDVASRFTLQRASIAKRLVAYLPHMYPSRGPATPPPRIIFAYHSTTSDDLEHHDVLCKAFEAMGQHKRAHDGPLAAHVLDDILEYFPADYREKVLEHHGAGTTIFYNIIGTDPLAFKELDHARKKVPFLYKVPKQYTFCGLSLDDSFTQCRKLRILAIYRRINGTIVTLNVRDIQDSIALNTRFSHAARKGGNTGPPKSNRTGCEGASYHDLHFLEPINDAFYPSFMTAYDTANAQRGPRGSRSTSSSRGARQRNARCPSRAPLPRRLNLDGITADDDNTFFDNNKISQRPQKPQKVPKHAHDAVSLVHTALPPGELESLSTEDFESLDLISAVHAALRDAHEHAPTDSEILAGDYDNAIVGPPPLPGVNSSTVHIEVEHDANGQVCFNFTDAFDDCAHD